MDLLKELEKGNILPVYFFCGSEKLLMEEALKKVEALVVEPATRCFNYNMFQGSEAAAETVIEVAQSMPMMAKKRLVVVKDIDKFSAAELEKLGRYLKDPSPYTCLVLIAEKADMRKGFFQALKGSTIQFAPMYENMLPQWIRKEAESRGKKIAPDAAQYLVEAIGSDLLRLKNELEKVALYSGERKEITVKDVEAVSTKSKLKSIFDLTDAVGGKDAGKAVRALGDLLDNGENGVYILYMVTRHLRLVWKVKELIDAGVKGDAMAKEAGMHPFVLKGIMGQVKRFSMEDLREAFPRLLEADSSLKSGRLTDRLVLEQLFLTLARGREGVRKPLGC